MAFESIRRILPGAVRAAGIGRQVTAARVIALADETVRRLWGEERARYVQAISFCEGELKLTASAPAALQELKLDQVRIQNEINRAFGSKAIHSMRFVSKSF